MVKTYSEVEAARINEMVRQFRTCPGMKPVWDRLAIAALQLEKEERDQSALFARETPLPEEQEDLAEKMTEYRQEYYYALGVFHERCRNHGFPELDFSTSQICSVYR